MFRCGAYGEENLGAGALTNLARRAVIRALENPNTPRYYVREERDDGNVLSWFIPGYNTTRKYKELITRPADQLYAAQQAAAAAAALKRQWGMAGPDAFTQWQARFNPGSTAATWLQRAMPAPVTSTPFQIPFKVQAPAQPSAVESAGSGPLDPSILQPPAGVNVQPDPAHGGGIFYNPTVPTQPPIKVPTPWLPRGGFASLPASWTSAAEKAVIASQAAKAVLTNTPAPTEAASKAAQAILNPGGSASSSAAATPAGATPGPVEAGFFDNAMFKKPSFWLGTAALTGMIAFLAKTNNGGRHHKARR